jgi:hypothetical protein
MRRYIVIGLSELHEWMRRYVTYVQQYVPSYPECVPNNRHRPDPSQWPRYTTNPSSPQRFDEHPNNDFSNPTSRTQKSDIQTPSSHLFPFLRTLPLLLRTLSLLIRIHPLLLLPQRNMIRPRIINTPIHHLERHMCKKRP